MCLAGTDTLAWCIVEAEERDAAEEEGEEKETSEERERDRYLMICEALFG